MDFTTPWAVILSAFLATAVLVFFKSNRTFHSRSLPPGPPGLPIFGNILQMSTDNLWMKFAEWGKQYGDVVYISFFGRPVIILNSAKALADLLEKRSAIYSDRPVFPFAGEMIGYSESIPIITYGNRHRAYRKLMTTALASRKAEELHPIQELKTRNFLNLLLKSPEQFPTHIQHTFAATVFLITHGYTVAEKDDPFISLAERVNAEFALAITPGAYLVDVLPILQYVPAWFPGASFKRQAKEWRQTMVRFRDEPYESVKRQVANGTALPSFTAELIESNPNPTAEEELTYKWASATFYAAGADTTRSAITSFFLAMTVYPEVQQKAQAELDRVVGPSRLPTFKDRADLPYIEAVIKEIHRWIPVGPLAIPHKLIQDDIYEGFHLPAGSMIFPNTWAILHDPARYPSPSEFRPERYLPTDSTEPDPSLDPRPFAFGYGRRVCPGRHLADDSLYIAVTMTLAVFAITKAVDEHGVPIEPKVGSTSGTMSHPLPFKCCIAPRSPEAVALIRASKGSSST